MPQCPPICCPSDDLGYVADLPDIQTYLAVAYGPQFDPPLNSDWNTLECFAVAYSALSQADADAAAASLVETCQNVVLCAPPPPPPPPLSIGPLPSCLCFQTLYDEQVPLTGSAASDSVVLTLSGDVPPGLEMQGQVLSGVPLEAGTFLFAINASVNGATASRQYIFSVIEVTSGTPPPFTLGAPYSFQLEAIGGSGAYSWRVDSGALPTGLGLSNTGLISGTPTDAGNSPVQFEVADDACEIFPPTPQPEPPVPVPEKITISSFVTPQNGCDQAPSQVLASLSAVGVGAGPGMTWAVISGSLPAGVSLSFSGSSATIVGSLGYAPGPVAPFTVQAATPAGTTDSVVIQLSVFYPPYVLPPPFAAPSVSQGYSLYLGCFPPGTYRIDYVNGAMSWSNAFSQWSICDYILGPTGGYGFSIQYNNGTNANAVKLFYDAATAPNTCMGYSGGQAAVEAANDGAYITLNHSGGAMYFIFNDNHYPDNIDGSPNPTFTMTKL